MPFGIGSSSILSGKIQGLLTNEGSTRSPLQALIWQEISLSPSELDIGQLDIRVAIARTIALLSSFK
jgi:hypothetical protein